MTGSHVLDCAWLCPCGQRVGAGERVHPWGEAWRCAACLPTPKVTPWRKPKLSRARNLPLNPPDRRYANREKPHIRYAKGTTLEELLEE
jgi:hypothetical protein